VHPIALRLSRVKDFALTEISSWVCKHLFGYSLAATDGLGCFAGIGYTGLAHEAILASGDSVNDARRGLQVGQHHDRQREERSARYLLCGEQKALASVHGRVLLPFQPALRPWKNDQTPGSCRSPFIASPSAPYIPC